MKKVYLVWEVGPWYEGGDMLYEVFSDKTAAEEFASRFVACPFIEEREVK